MPLKADKILLYGANGFTGKLAADYISTDQYLAWFRSRLILSGRSQHLVEPISKRTNLPFRVFSLTNPTEIDQALADIRIVIHMAGPFTVTCEPMLKACIRNKCHYLDITGEPVIYKLIFETMRVEITTAQILAIPSSGFDIVPTDCIANRLSQLVPKATHLDLAICQCPMTVSSGTSLTVIDAFIHNSQVPNFGARVNGELVTKDPAYCNREIAFPTAGKKLGSFMPWADCYTGFVTTKIPNIHFFIPMLWPIHLVIKYLMMGAQLALRIPLVKPGLEKLIKTFVKGPTIDQCNMGHVDVWGEVRNERNGEKATMTMIVPEAYKFTAYAALESAKCIFEGSHKVKYGPSTPSLVFGYDYIKNIPGVSFGEIKAYPPVSQ